MSALTTYPETQPLNGVTNTDFAAISAQLAVLGVQFERWQAECEFAADA